MLDTKTPVPTPVNEKTPQKLGVYEGGGYVNKGVYRPLPNCLMNNLHTIDIFCPVCSQAIRKQIDFLCRWSYGVIFNMQADGPECSRNIPE